MPSSLTWLDYSERDRRRALDVVDLFRERGTLDELGIGAVRDSFSDLLFPGTSTIQTRACYFLLIPWTCLRLEKGRVSSAAAPDRADWEERRLNERLLAGGETWGLFGASAGAALQRLPSAVYWGGLGTWGIRLFPGARDAYYRSLDAFYRKVDRSRSTEVDPEGRRGAPANWHPHVPEPPAGFPDEVSVALRRGDAEYLRDRIQTLHAGTLLAELVARAEPTDLAAESAWGLAGWLDLPPRVREQLHHGKLFAIVMHGAALLYNLMLAEALGHEEWIERYRGKLATWSGEMGEMSAELAAWDLGALWRTVEPAERSIRFPTRAFVERWVGIVRSEGPAAAFREGSPARPLIRDREARLKGGRARLQHRRHLELWGGASGADRLDFRWRPARRLLEDVFDGLGREPEGA